MSPPEELAVFRGEPLARHVGRSLTAWLSDDEALTALLGRNPIPEDDLTNQRQRIVKARDELAARPIFRPRSPVLELSDRTHLDRAADRKDIQAAFASLKWTVEMVDLLVVQALQKQIRAEKLAERAAPVVADPSRLTEFCLPGEQTEPPIGTFTDIDKLGFAISSVNPNLRIAGTNVSSAELSTPAGPVSMQALTFFINFGSSYINVARWEDRYFLRDGYHRVAALLKAGITRVPCVVVDAAVNSEEILPGAGTFSSDVFLGDRPPLLPDFFDPTVSDEVMRAATRKVIRVRGDEFFVQD